MKKYFKYTALLIATAAALAISGCGGGTDSYIDSWKINTVDNKFNIHAVFNQQYEMDGEALINFKDYGTVYIGQDDTRHFTLDIALNKLSFNDLGLQAAAGLPTGAAFPNIVTMPMMSTLYKEEAGKWKIYGYFGMQNNPAKSLAGVAIQIEGINSSFPVLSITQNYFDANNQRYAAFTIYGPKLDQNNQVITPGGIFIVGDISFLISGKANAESTLEISGPDAEKYQDPASRQRLLEEVARQIQSTGLIRQK